MGFTMVTLCNTCQINLSLTKEKLDSDPAYKAKVNEKLKETGLEYKGSVAIKHFLYVLVDDFGVENIKAKVEVPLSEYNIAPFYGCHNIRPSELHAKNNGGENPYRPTSLERLIEALEGASVEYASKNKCCGFHVDLQAPDTSNTLTGNALVDAIDNNADIVVTPCPLCHLNMDIKQESAGKLLGRDIDIPVLHMPQMVALALGCTPKEIGLKHHITKAKQLIS
jgi:succinate dehydrogenase / fumarate reductase cytochrome b subunit